MKANAAPSLRLPHSQRLPTIVLTIDTQNAVKIPGMVEPPKDLGVSTLKLRPGDYPTPRSLNTVNPRARPVSDVRDRQVLTSV
jgi:hypothetical protein